MSVLLSDIQELLDKVLLSNCCLGDQIHDESDADEPVLSFWKAKYNIMDELAGNLRDRKRELEELDRS